MFDFVEIKKLKSCHQHFRSIGQIFQRADQFYQTIIDRNIKERYLRRRNDKGSQNMLFSCHKIDYRKAYLKGKG